MAKLDTQLNIACGPSNATSSILKIKSRLDQLKVVFRDGVELGTLNNRISNALSEIIAWPLITFEAIADSSMIREIIGRAVTAKDAVVHVNINVHGTKEARYDVGKELSNKSVFLQRPNQLRPDSLYDNPHCIPFLDIKNSAASHSLVESNDDTSRLGQAEQFRVAVTGVYASLKRGSRLKRLDGDERLRTTLLP